MTKINNLIGRTVSVRTANKHIGFGELCVDRNDGSYSVWGLRFMPTDVIAIDPITKAKMDGEMDEWSVGAASIIRLVDPLPHDIEVSASLQRVHSITLPGLGFSPEILLCILIGSWVESGGGSDIIDLNTLIARAKARQLPKVVYSPISLKNIWSGYISIFGIDRISATKFYWQWLSDAPIAQIRQLAIRVHKIRNLPTLNTQPNFESFEIFEI
jgi:hypothetical protein